MGTHHLESKEANAPTHGQWPLLKAQEFCLSWPHRDYVSWLALVGGSSYLNSGMILTGALSSLISPLQRPGGKLTGSPKTHLALTTYTGDKSPGISISNKIISESWNLNKKSNSVLVKQIYMGLRSFLNLKIILKVSYELLNTNMTWNVSSFLIHKCYWLNMVYFDGNKFVIIRQYLVL